MRLGIIGPTHWKKNCAIVGLKEEKYLEQTKKIAALVKSLGFEIVVNPHSGSIYHIFSQEFQKLRGEICCIIPLQDTEFGNDWLDKSVCTRIIDCGDWRNMHASFNKNCDAMLCIGFSVGVLSEIALSKWFNPTKERKKVLVIKDFVSACLPAESVKDLNIEYVSLKQLGKKLKDILK